MANEKVHRVYSNRCDNKKFSYYLGLTKHSAIVIANFISQLTFKRLLHRETVECLIYNHIYGKSVFDLVRGLFQINVHLN